MHAAASKKTLILIELPQERDWTANEFTPMSEATGRDALEVS